MATQLQVNAQTAQAVGAFNALAASINQANTSFARLNTTMNSGAGSASRYSNSVTAINSSFARLTSAMTTTYHAAVLVSAGLGLAFDSILKQLDKLQGFNAIMSVTAGSAEVAAQSYDFLRKTADRLGLRFEDLASNYAKLVASLPAGAKGLEIAEKAFMGVSMAARTLHASNADTQLMFYAITQMASKGVVSMEELRRQLGEKLPGVMQIAARAFNTLPETLEAAIRKGIVQSEKFLPVLSEAFIRTFGDSSAKAAESVSASLNRLKNVWTDFVKVVLDSGGGVAIVGLFDALREKLSDPYLIARFSELVKDLATRFTEFVQKLTADDIRNAFETFAKGVDFLVKAIEKLITALTWVINNAGKAGAILGAMAGASAGSLAGPWGALAGAIVGGGVGGYVGTQLSSTDAENASRAQQDAIAKQAKAMDAQQREMFKLNALVPMLGNFKALRSFDGLENLLKAENQNTKTLSDLNRILTGPQFKTDQDKANAVKEYAKYGVVLNPATAKLSDTFGAGKSKKTAAEKSEDATLSRAFGLDGNFQTELSNLNHLREQGRLTTEKYGEAIQALIQKQPYMEAANRAAAKAQREENKFREEALDLTFKQIDVKDKLQRQLVDEMALATMRSEDVRVEHEAQHLANVYIEAGIPIKEKQLEQWREEIRLRTRVQELTAIGEQISNATIDRYTPAIKQQQAMDRLVANPKSGFTEQSAQDYTIGTDKNFEGTQRWLDAQKRQLEDYYAYIDMLRGKDRISEEASNIAKAKAGSTYNQLRLQQTTDLFSTLATLSSSGNRRLAAIGKAAAIANATMKAYEAINVALALPFPMNILQAAAVGLQAFANIQAIRSTGTGFMIGGYTGDGGRSQVAGVVHGQEYVLNASATRRNRSILDAMNSGATIGGTTASQRVEVVVNNNGSSTVATTQERDTPDGKQIEITIEDVVVKSVRRGGKVASALEGQYGLNRSAGTVR